MPRKMPRSSALSSMEKNRPVATSSSLTPLPHWWPPAEPIASPMQSRLRSSRSTPAQPQLNSHPSPATLHPERLVILSEAKDLCILPLCPALWPLLHVHLLQVLRYLDIPPQFLLHQVAQLPRSLRLPGNQISPSRTIAARPHPLH